MMNFTGPIIAMRRWKNDEISNNGRNGETSSRNGKRKRYDAWSGQPFIMENTKTIGKEIVEHTWGSYAEIVQALEVGRVGENIFLKKEDAERKFEKYWKPYWGKQHENN